MATNITNLPVDVLSRIISTVAVLPDGACEVAKSMSTCQRFLEASNNIVVLRVVSFQNVQVLERCHLFQKKNGLLVKCAKACNPLAEYRLAQLILVTSTQLVHVNMSKARLNHFRDYSPKYKHSRPKARDDAALASFMASFIPSQEPNPNPNSNPNPNPNPSPSPSPRPLSFHWEFVELFMRKSTPSDIQQLPQQLFHYIELFAGSKLHVCLVFLHLVRLLFCVNTTDKNMVLVRESNNHFDWRSTGAVFEEIRERAVGALIAIIPIFKAR